MTVVRETSIHGRLQSGIAALQRDAEVPAGLYRGRDAAGCLRRGALDARTPESYDPERERWMSLIGDVEMFDVVSTRVALSDVEARLHSYIDMVVQTSGEMLLVLLRPHDLPLDGPLNGDVFDMIASMYLSGIHSGLVIYFSEKKFLSFFVNPDKKTYKELLEIVISGSRQLYACELRGRLPEGNPGELCRACPHGKNCDSAVTARGGHRGNREDASGGIHPEGGNRQETGEQAGASVSEGP